MFGKILIANRGEIACRVIKTAKRLGMRTVAVYSDADRNALHVRQADEAVHIGAAPSNESYLRSEKIINAALKTGANAIHPGYGFLSENADLAKACTENDIVFIGPPASAIESMGSKSASKRIMHAAGIPLVPGYHGDDQHHGVLKKSADEMGYPVLLKAVAGGGGKGMRQVWSSDEFSQALEDAKREAKASFGNDDMLVEKYLVQPRHVEVQVFCDQSSNGVYLFERDCSVQRRHQKIIEEAPAPNLSEDLRSEIGQTAVKAAQAINYVGAGTVEFLLDSNGRFYFMEMNTRLQVEHPVTEMITGEDLVAWQLRVAQGHDLPKQQEDLSINGHSFEARIYAEDPNNDFLPTTGTLTTLVTPEESNVVRVDTGVIEGDQVSPYYDPMIAKLIVWGETREQALDLLGVSLRQYFVAGVTTNIEFLHNLSSHRAFQAAELDTSFIEKHRDTLFAEKKVDHEKLAGACAIYQTLCLQNSVNTDPWSAADGWRMNAAGRLHFGFSVDGQDVHCGVQVKNQNSPQAQASFMVTANGQETKTQASLDGHRLRLVRDAHLETMHIFESGDQLTLFTQDGRFQVVHISADLGEEETHVGNDGFIAPMNGSVIEILVKPGDMVDAGQPVLIMEAMKMQHTMQAPVKGVVTDVFCAQGELVDGGTPLLNFEPETERGDHEQ